MLVRWAGSNPGSAMRRSNGVGHALFALSISCVFAAGCASLNPRAERLPDSDRIAVYDGISQDPRPYRLLKRIWGESWRSAFMVPRYGSAAEGAADLQNQAVALGGDAIMYFNCYELGPMFWQRTGPGLVCNGNVIRYVR